MSASHAPVSADELAGLRARDASTSGADGTSVPEALLNPEVARAVAEYLFERGWSDGLPVLPATEAVVDEFLKHTDRDPEEILAGLPQLDRVATVRDIALHAAMAGCRPDYLPVVLSAWEALSHERSARGGGWQSTSGPAPLVMVNGPIRHRLGINSTGGVFGPGFRANMTIPRALGLTVRNGFGVVPQELEQATQGVPGRWTMCLGEDEESSPWEPHSTEAGVASGQDAVSVMLVRTSEFIDNRSFRTVDELLEDFADTLQRMGPWIFRNSSAVIVMNPAHAQALADAGMSRDDVRTWLARRSGRTEAELSRVGKGLSDRPFGPFDPDHFHPVLAEPTATNLPILVAGSPNAAISMVVRVFSTWSGRAFPIH
ncbi:hypothetical protein [Citricoccus sp. GCM10030269]|uniref:hypothetical protein n=1 Tax=Citricoccus sp. GCM10030269 TaxID=3273388 RepID=UPI0036061DAE